MSSAETRAPHEEVETEPRRRGLRKVLISLGVLGLVLALIAGGALWFFTDRYAGNIARVSDGFADLDADTRPAPAIPAQQAGEKPVTFLLVGSDTRASARGGVAAGGRSDAIMIARFSADRQHAQLISVPRDSWVDIPCHGMDEVNAAYAYGGPKLLIQTVEQLTDVRIDHYVAIDFEGLVQVTDDPGGVDVVVAESTSNGPYTFPAGVNHLDDDQARWYLGSATACPAATSTGCAGSSSTCRRCSASCSTPAPSPTRAGWTPRCWP